VTSVDFSNKNNNFFASGSKDGTAILWQLNRHMSSPYISEIYKFSHLRGEINKCLFSPNDDYLLTLSTKEGEVILWPISESEIFKRVEKEGGNRTLTPQDSTFLKDIFQNTFSKKETDLKGKEESYQVIEPSLKN